MSQGPAIPTFIFRGHATSIHALHFFASNLYLASGDSDGWIVVWSISTKRPIAVWKGHEGGVLGLKDWDGWRLISHGRDHQIRVWQLPIGNRQNDNNNDLSTKLPVDGAKSTENKWPWLLFSVTANALNYCAFSICAVPRDSKSNNQMSLEGHNDNDDSESDARLIASANGLDAGGIDIFHLPGGRRVSQIKSDKDVSTAMVMAVSIHCDVLSGRLTIVSGYESGHVMVHVGPDTTAPGWTWKRILCSQPHTQPVLAVDLNLDGRIFLSSAADAFIARFEIPRDGALGGGDNDVKKVMNTKHAGQQDVKIRDDGKIFATAGWDKRVRVYSVKTMKEVAVLKWHQEGCYAVAFALTSWDHGDKNDLEGHSDELVGRSTIELLKMERDAKVQGKHWLAAGGKDGKISLWDIY